MSNWIEARMKNTKKLVLFDVDNVESIREWEDGGCIIVFIGGDCSYIVEDSYETIKKGIIDRSLKKISGENSVKTIENVKKTYAETYFAKDDDGKWSEK